MSPFLIYKIKYIIYIMELSQQPYVYTQNFDRFLVKQIDLLLLYF